MAKRHWLENGKTHYVVIYSARSNADRSIRSQKRESGIVETTNPEEIEKLLTQIENRLRDEARQVVWTKEGQGITWGNLVKRWEEVLMREAYENEKALKE